MEINQFNLRVLLASAVTAVAVAAILGGSAALHRSAPSGGAPAVSPTATGSPSPDDGQPTGSPAPARWDGKGVPPILLQLDGREVALAPWGYCYSNGCVDGFPQPPFEDVGVRDAVSFSFPLAGWSFEATFSASAGGRCERQVSVPVKRTGEHTFVVPPAGPPGSYDVDVFGRGPGGDVIVTFRWTTEAPGFFPGPSGSLGLVSDDDGDYVAYPLELTLANLATTPERASVTVTVTAADGTATTVGPIRAEKSCSGNGTLYFRESGGAAEPFELGPGPFRYRAELLLDGTTYVGTALWPRDERADEAPYTDLRFDPPLPAFTG